MVSYTKGSQATQPAPKIKPVDRLLIDWGKRLGRLDCSKEGVWEVFS